jgi:hypothetical protein
VAALGANSVFADNSAEESAALSHREPVDSRAAGLDRQNTTERSEIPGNDGGRAQKALATESNPEAKAE